MSDAKDTRTIHQRLIDILGELPPIGKNQKNAQQGFMFRGHDDVLNALNPLLAKHGVFVAPDVLERSVSERTTSKGSVMFEVSLHVGYRFYGAGGDEILASVWGEGTDMGDKATSKAMTMAFKSALNQVFAINTQETIDPDAHGVEETTSRTFTPPPPRTNGSGDLATDAQKKKLKAIVGNLTRAGKITPEQINKVVGSDFDTALDTLPKREASSLIERLEKYEKNLLEKYEKNLEGAA